MGLEGLRPCIFPQIGPTHRKGPHPALRPFPAPAPQPPPLPHLWPLLPSQGLLRGAGGWGGGLARTTQSCSSGQPSLTFQMDNMDKTRASEGRPGLARGSSQGFILGYGVCIWVPPDIHSQPPNPQLLGILDRVEPCTWKTFRLCLNLKFWEVTVRTRLPRGHPSCLYLPR